MQATELIEQLNAVTPADYRLGQPHPPVGDIVSQLVGGFPSISGEEQHATRMLLSSDAAALLLQHAWECASQAVRRGAPGLVREGLIALAIEDGRIDWRISIIRPMAVLFHSTEMLGVESAPLFEEAAGLATDPSLKEALRTFPSRSPESRDLGKAFSIIKKMTPEGVTFEWTPLFAPGKMRRKIWWLRLRKFFGFSR